MKVTNLLTFQCQGIDQMPHASHRRSRRRGSGRRGHRGVRGVKAVEIRWRRRRVWGVRRMDSGGQKGIASRSRRSLLLLLLLLLRRRRDEPENGKVKQMRRNSNMIQMRSRELRAEC